MKIALTKGKYAIVDADDYEYLNSFSWYYHSGGYAARTEKRRQIFMHRLLLGLTDRKIQCDHVNGDRLDNRRANLRVASNSQNVANRGPGKKNKSGFKGVHKHTQNGRWIAQIRVDGRTRHLGCFDTPQEAALVYNKAARSAFGEFAHVV